MKKSTETKRRLIDTTKSLLKQAGIITIKDICDNAVVNMAAVNYHFGDKENLVSIAINEILGDLKTEIIRRVNTISSESTEDTILAFLDLVYNFSVENPGVLAYMFSFSTASADNSFLDTFLLNREFTSIVFEKIDELSPASQSSEAAAAKYMSVFSTFLMPMFCEYGIAKYGLTRELGMYSLRNSEFKKQFITQIIRILK